MWSFVRDFFRDVRHSQTVIIFDEDGLGQSRRHEVRPSDLLWAVGAAAAAIAVLAVSLVIFSPLRRIVPDGESRVVVQDVRLNALRLQAMQDSLEEQQQYLAHLRQVVTGQLDSASMAAEMQRPSSGTINTDVASIVSEQPLQDWTDHEQPALSFWRFASASSENPARTVAVAERSLSSLQLPVLPPVGGFMTRGFDARGGHFGVDFAVDEGSIVRAVGDGYVIFADWSHEGGYTIAVQHSDGYVSMYKHNQRLLKRVGERVRARDPIAASGNSGEASTGPHLHFEFWQNGLAQDPRYYFVGP